MPPTGRATAVEIVLKNYPLIYEACRRRQVRGSKKPGTLSAHQAGALEQVDEVLGTSLTQLARQMGVTVSTMSAMADRLELGGCVKRQHSDADGRRIHLHLTAKGKRLKAQQSVLDPELVAALLRKLNDDERKIAILSLELLAVAAKKMTGSGEQQRILRAGEAELPHSSQEKA